MKWVKKLTIGILVATLLWLLGQTSAWLGLLAIPAAFLPKEKGIEWIKRVLTGFDRLANAYTGGHDKNTISSRCYHNRDKFGWKQLGIVLDWLDPGHCKKYYDKENSGKELW